MLTNRARCGQKRSVRRAGAPGNTGQRLEADPGAASMIGTLSCEIRTENECTAGASGERNVRRAGTRGRHRPGQASQRVTAADPSPRSPRRRWRWRSSTVRDAWSPPTGRWWPCWAGPPPRHARAAPVPTPTVPPKPGARPRLPTPPTTACTGRAAADLVDLASDARTWHAYREVLRGRRARLRCTRRLKHPDGRSLLGRRSPSARCRRARPGGPALRHGRQRPPRPAGPAAAPADARPGDPAAQPHPVLRTPDGRAGGGARPSRAAPAGSACATWTSTASRPSTTPSATASATGCSPPSPAADGCAAAAGQTRPAHAGRPARRRRVRAARGGLHRHRPARRPGRVACWRRSSALRPGRPPAVGVRVASASSNGTRRRHHRRPP